MKITGVCHFLSIFCLLVGGLAAHAQTEAQNFDSDPSDWTAVTDGELPSSLGHSATGNAQGVATGEGGGTWQRNSAFEYYADTVNLASGLTGSDTITASGRFFAGNFNIFDGQNDVSEVGIGHFDTTQAMVRDGLVGFLVKDEDSDSMRIRATVRAGGSDNLIADTTWYFGQDSVFDWAYIFDPATSQFDLTVTLVSGQWEDGDGNPITPSGGAQSISETVSDTTGISVNAFGIGNRTRTDTAGREVDVFLDDVTYSIVETTPPPAEAVSSKVFELEQQWWVYADPGGQEHPDASINPITGNRDGFELDRGEVGGESSMLDPLGELVVTASRSNARIKQAQSGGDPETADPPTYVHELNGNTSHVRMWDMEGNLLWDKGRSRGPDNVDNETGNPPPDGIPDDVPFNSDGEPEDEIEHAAFTTHSSNRGRYVVAGGEDQEIEVWEVRDADGNILADPVLVRTLFIPGGRDAAFDSLGFSSSGELLTGGTEFKGHLEVWRATGHPDTWEHVGHASHGDPDHKDPQGNDQFRLGKAVNEFDWSSDDEYVLMAGTDTWGSFWDADIVRDAGTNEITAVNFTRLASMDHPLRSSKAARFSGDDRLCVISSKDQRIIVFDVEDLKNHTNPDTSPAPVVILHNGIYHGRDTMTGVEIEPGGATHDGRFFVLGGGPEENWSDHPNSAGYRSSFFRVFEVNEIQGDATSPDPTEPDPIWVQPIFHTEFFHFNADDSLLTTSHDDATARLWKVSIPGTRTLHAEAFNELTPHSGGDRWTITGGGSEWGVTYDKPANIRVRENPPGEFMSPSVSQSANWVGHRGARYLGGDNLGGVVRALELNNDWDLTGHTELLVSFAAAAADNNVFESGDFLRLVADADGEPGFETTIAEFLPDDDGDLALNGTGQKLDFMFRDFYFDLAPLLPAGFAGAIRFRIEASTDRGDEELAFDSLRVTGRPENDIDIQAGASAGEYGEQTGTFTISRSGDASAKLSVDLEVAGSGMAGSDYQSLPASVTFAAGQSTVVLEVLPLVDNDAEGDESVQVTVAESLRYNRTSESPAEIVIADNPTDAWRHVFGVDDLSGDEDQDGLSALAELVYALDPTQHSSLPEFRLHFESDTALAFSTDLNATLPGDISVLPRYSTDLKIWHTDQTPWTRLDGTVVGDQQQVTFRFEPGGNVRETFPSMFLRLNYVREDPAAQ